MHPGHCSLEAENRIQNTPGYTQGYGPRASWGQRQGQGHRETQLCQLLCATERDPSMASISQSWLVTLGNNPVTRLISQHRVKESSGKEPT